ncbi:MAG: CehA/McbA family metallohydrolase [Caloramator sp.]|nr:CehA/McbA family metallohydrolase [Caloramator sp.]
MFKKGFKAYVAVITSFVMLTATFTFTGKTVKAQTGPELLITELMVKSTAGTDPNEYIEVYNNTNSPINIKDYKFTYPSSDIDVSKIIPPKGVIVICTTNNTTPGAFNLFYGTSLTEDNFVNFKTTALLGNSGPKTVALAKDSGEEVCKATYNSADFDVKKSTTYKYPESGIDMVLLGQKQEPSPGVVQVEQVPQEMQNDTQPPRIQHTPVEQCNNASDLLISADVTDDVQVSYVKLFYRETGALDYKNSQMQKGSGNTYSYSIPKSELTANGIEYYIEASDGINTVTLPKDISNPFKVQIKEVDSSVPKVTIISPKSGESLNIKRPLISASISDDTGIEKDSIKLFVDNVDRTTESSIKFSSEDIVKNAVIEFKPSEDLKDGEHIIRILAKDISELKNTADFSWNFYIGEKTYNIYFGQIHSHTNFSDGLGTPDEAYSYAKNVAKADFFAVTDHSNSFDNDTSATILDGSSSNEWTQLHQIADKYNEDGKFAAIAGYEMTWSGSTGGWGHINTFNTPGFLSRNSKINNKAIDLKMYYDELKKIPNSISQFNHPGITYGDFSDFGYYDENIDKLISLVEVGNGEGPVRGSGYFPSYEYYTRALDKGWHLAPTNNHDNHKGNWILANTARTAVLAESLNRDNIYDALRKMRVYATEDSNLRIIYKVNDMYLGSTLKNPDKLNFSININDPDSDDVIGKVSIIANGGIVAASKYFNSNTAEWNFTLDPQYSYYYVRVDEKDSDIAVTAPVWTGEVVPVGLSGVSSDLKLTETSKPVNITATVYNNSSNPITNVKVEFFKNDISEENKIDEKTIDTVNSGSTNSASTTFTAQLEGTYNIYVRATINYNGVTKIFTSSTAVEFINSENAVKVLIDAGHQNQYVSGDYKGKINKFKSMLLERKVIAVEDNNGLTDDDLKGVDLLVLTDSQSKDSSSYGLVKSNYTDEEIQVIKRYIDNGGSIIITSRADYNDIGITDPQYQNANQGNRVLEAIGSNLRFNDDEVIDNTNNNGQNYRLLFDDYVSAKYNLTKGITEDIKYSFYSGCSIILKDNADISNIDYVVKGHDTTEILDSDKQNDAKAVDKGNVYVLAAEKLNDKAKLIVSGSTFFSDFETTGDNQYANVQITDNILDWILNKETVITPISQVRIDSDKNNVPDNMGKTYTIEGYVTAESTAVGNKHSFFDVIYVQDETGGITVFGVSTKSIPLGTKVKVTGKVDQYMEDTELQISNENKDIKIFDTSTLIEPKTMSTKDSMLEENEGWLVKVSGIVKRIEGQNIYIDDGSGEARVYLEGYIAGAFGDGKWDSRIKEGEKISAIGLASEDSEGHRIRVRNADEIVYIEAQKDDLEVLLVSAPEKIVRNSDAKITIKAINNSSSGKKATLIIGLFDENNRLLIYGASSQIIESKKDVDLTVMMRIIDVPGKLKIKYFIWDSIDNMNIISKVKEINE